MNDRNEGPPLAHAATGATTTTGAAWLPAPERWERIHATLQSALERTSDARIAYLEQVGRTDPALRHEVETLLDAGLPSGPFDALVEACVEPTEAPLPSRIGAWQPVRLLGRGGMGAVYLVERVDGAYEQRAALKLLPAGTGAELRHRFLAERRILARLRHPHIARLLDGGATPDGVPWLVLEYVAGSTLTTYCERKRLTVEARLRLFLDVCAAVSYAHANLIVHRDIKPANVLVMDDGRTQPSVKLLDFGIAKLVEADAAIGAPVTRVGLRMLTPDYAAPEQVRGEPVTTATDVYQLGVLLYELLCGERPHAPAGRALPELEREICQREPMPPSARTDRPARPALAGDLDTIVLHALAKEPERRYPSVEAFAGDVRRHLDGLPVRARPDTLPYRAGKFVRRHRTGVLAAALIVLLLAASAVVLLVQNRRIEAERDRATLAAGFLTELIEGLEPARVRGSAIEAREILDRTTARVVAELPGQPLLQARLFDVLGRVYQMRGHYAEAEPLLRRALTLRTGRLAAGHPDLAASRLVLANLLGETDRDGEAMGLLEAAAAGYAAGSGNDDPRVAVVRLDIALARRAEGDLAAAEAILEDIVAMLREHADYAADLATATLYLGKVRLERGDATRAEPLLREALEMRRSLFGDEHPTVANALDGMGELMLGRGDYAAAEEAHREALAIRRTLFPDRHADVGVSLLNIGITVHKQGRDDEAHALLRQALASLAPTFGEAHSLVRTTRAYLDSAGHQAAVPPTRQGVVRHVP